MKGARYILLLFVAISCIDPFETDSIEGPQLLTVEGMVTTGVGPHTIKLSRSANYGSIFEALVRPVSGATVIVRDDLGGVTFFTESTVDRGAYSSPSNFSGVVGRSYTLQFQLVDGKVYTSFPEKLESVPIIENLSYQVVTIPVEGEINARSGVQLLATISDPSDQNNFYFWRNDPSVYILRTRPDLFFIRPPDADDRDPDPKDCCITCFRTELAGNESIFIAQDDNFNGLSTKVPVGFVEDDGLRFVQTYRIDVRQLSISQGAYRFLRLVKQQSEINGSVFDPPPANIRGNMIRLDNPEEVVLGYFMASGESKKRIYINGQDLSFRQNVALILDDSREVSGAQLLPPLDWRP
jgi:hypothetical protein